MTDRIRIKGGFTAIPNALLRSSEIGLEHKGMLGLIASHADDWEFRQADMLRKSKCSKDRYYRIINDLKDKGYLQIVPRDKVNGRYSGADWTLDFSPCPENQEVAPVPENQDEPCPEKPDTENQDDKKNKIRIPKEESVAAPHNPDDFFEDFLSAHPRPRDQDRTRELWDGVVAGGADPKDLIRAARIYADEQKGNSFRFIAGSDAWLDRKGHLDALRSKAPPPSAMKVNEGIAATIKKGKPFLVTNITDTKAGELVALDLVTVEQCQAVGLQP